MFFDTIECILLFIFEIKNNVIFGIFFFSQNRAEYEKRVRSQAAKFQAT